MGNGERFALRNDGHVFRHVDPPFGFNAPHVSAYPVEVTGWHLLDGIRKRFGWSSFEGKRFLDFGCGVRFAKTIANLQVPIGLYAGVDVHREAISWLQANMPDDPFMFAHLNARNVYYNPEGSQTLGSDALTQIGLSGMDAACMISVITHQTPQEATLTFQQLRRAVATDGLLYFTAFIDEDGPYYWEQDASTPGHMSTYRPDVLIGLLEATGWRFEAAYEKSTMQQTAFVCQAR